ncbi:xylulokinase [Nocardiopsis ansamitocini]|uniref:Sugar kinase n=1 Tax=Nocardiopsis ansamitocini TaxID=1670832 RepID=A0A9W6P7K6_9ACTN|nr:FGGY family carbohydrate kinase [Nocardiopsis ansamitocini]GLU48522.1 sugar kinase [Nocardiopsis ansamitocini]
MATDALLGIDLGTSGVKALVVATDGTVLAEADAAHPVSAPAHGWAETDPKEWWTACVGAVHAALARAGHPRIVAIGLDGQMHGLVLASADGTPVRPALLWADQRATGELVRWRGLSAAEQTRLANPLTPGMLGPLLSWTARHEPAALAAARWALLPKDWLRLHLTNNAATDPSDASATLLWDMPANTWSSAAIDAAGVPGRLLPPVRSSAKSSGELAPEAAAELGLNAGTPVAVGAGDTPAALHATGLRAQQAQLTVGSGAQLVLLTDTPAAVEGVNVYRTAAATGWYRMAAVQNAGIALEWVRGLLGADWTELYDAAAVGEPGAGKTLFVPHLTGERTPVLDPLATGVLSGLRLGTDRAAVLRAALEGVALSVRHAATALPGGLPASVRLAGGGARHPAFRRLLADVLGVELVPITLRSASGLGAALLAADAVGLSVPAPALGLDLPVRPGPDRAAYDDVFAAYTAAVDYGAHARAR